jgi:hypothetical protein
VQRSHTSHNAKDDFGFSRRIWVIVSVCSFLNASSNDPFPDRLVTDNSTTSGDEFKEKPTKFHYDRVYVWRKDVKWTSWVPLIFCITRIATKYVCSFRPAFVSVASYTLSTVPCCDQLPEGKPVRVDSALGQCHGSYDVSYLSQCSEWQSYYHVSEWSTMTAVCIQIIHLGSMDSNAFLTYENWQTNKKRNRSKRLLEFNQFQRLRALKRSFYLNNRLAGLRHRTLTFEGKEWKWDKIHDSMTLVKMTPAR